jgi:hypothetical protein
MRAGMMEERDVASGEFKVRYLKIDGEASLTSISVKAEEARRVPAHPGMGGLK